MLGNEPEWAVVRSTAEAPPSIGGASKGVEMAEEHYVGGSVRPLPRPNRRFAQGRVCAEPGCGTKLSIYNKWKYCWQHEPVNSYVPRGKRRSTNQAA